MIHSGGVKAAEGHLRDKDTVTAELKGAALTRTWMAGARRAERKRERARERKE